MCVHSDRLEIPTPTDVVKNERACDLSARFQSEEAGYLLTALKLNDFENALNAIEHFLGHLEIVDDKRPFESAAALLGNVLLHFEQLDRDGDGVLSKEDVDHCVNSEDNVWVSCHFDALAHAQLVCDHANGITRDALQNAHDVFVGMSYLHKNFDKVLAFSRSNSKTLSAEDIELFVTAHIRELPSDEIAGLLQLAMYLRHLHAQHEADRKLGLTDGDLVNLTPETLWQEEPAP